MVYRVAAILAASLVSADGVKLKIGFFTQTSWTQGKAALDTFMGWSNALPAESATLKFDTPVLKEYESSNVTAQVTEFLAAGIHALFPPYTSGATMAVISQVPDNTPMPILVWGGADDNIFVMCTSKNLSCFGGFTTASQYMSPSLEAIIAAHGQQKVYAITNTNGFSEKVRDGALAYITQSPFLTLEGSEQISVKSAALAASDIAIVDAAIATSPDVFLISGHAGDVEQVIERIRKAPTQPKAIVATNAFTSTANYQDAANMKFLIMPDQWARDPTMKDTIVGWDSNAFVSAMGGEATYHAASAGGLLVMLVHALKSLGSSAVTRESLAAALMGLNATETFYGKIDWNSDGTIIKYMYGMQEQAGDYKMVAPCEKLAKPMVTNPLMTLDPQTCGDIKKAYRSLSCCGNPTKIFNASRQLTAR